MKIIKLIEDLNRKRNTHVSVNNQLTNAVKTSEAIRQGDSFTPTLFNIILHIITTDMT